MQLWLIKLAFLLQVSSIANAYSLEAYWGQNADKQSKQKDLSELCKTQPIDTYILSSINDFKNLSLAVDSGCTGGSCANLAKQIKQCQAQGKKIRVSLGGPTGNYKFSSDAEATAFADSLWNAYGGGNGKNRPLGDVKVDGFDLNIQRGSKTGYAALAKRLKQKGATLSASVAKSGADPYVQDALKNIDVVSARQYSVSSVEKRQAGGASGADLMGFLGSSGSGSGYVPPQSAASAIAANGMSGATLWDASSAANSGFANALADALDALADALRALGGGGGNGGNGNGNGNGNSGNNNGNNNGGNGNGGGNGGNSNGNGNGNGGNGNGNNNGGNGNGGSPNGGGNGGSPNGGGNGGNNNGNGNNNGGNNNGNNNGGNGNGGGNIPSTLSTRTRSSSSAKSSSKPATSSRTSKSSTKSSSTSSKTSTKSSISSSKTTTSGVSSSVSKPLTTGPTSPATEPTGPTSPATEPTGPTSPATEPTGPTSPATEPTAPATEPTTPATEPTPTAPATEPTPTAPATEPTPTAPATEPTTPPTEPTTPPVLSAEAAPVNSAEVPPAAKDEAVPTAVDPVDPAATVQAADPVATLSA